MELQKYDVIIVGAGLSGMVIGEQMASNLNKKVLIIDRRDHIGGNCYDYIDPETGILINKYGAHLFHTNDEMVFKYINKFCKWKRWEHKVLGLIDEQYLPIPPNITTVNTTCNENIQNENGMDIWLHKNQAKYDEILNGEQMAKSRVGDVLYEKIFKHYTYKQWKKYPEDLAPEVLARIPVRNSFDDRYFSDKYQVLPEKGYTHFFECILEKNKDNIDLKLNTDFFDLKDKITKDQIVIYTGPIDTYFSDKGLPKLEYRSINFHIERKMNTNFYQPNSVVNYPGKDTPYTRCVEYKHFLNQKSNHTIYVKETTTDNGEPYYPVLNDRNKQLYEQYQKMAEAEGNNIHFIGRLASYKYFNMDQAIKNSLDYFEDNFTNKDKLISSFSNYNNLLDKQTNSNLLTLKKAHTLYKLLNIWFKTCDKFNIDTSLWAGTLLGSIRHKSIIPWDDDADVCIFEKDMKLLCSKKFISELNRWGCNLLLEESPFVVHIYLEKNINYIDKAPILINSDMLNIHNPTKYNNSEPFAKNGIVDIFIFEEISKYKFTPIGFAKYFGMDYIFSEEIYPLKTISLGGKIKVNIFNDSISYLKRLYGNNCLNNAVITHFHINDNKDINVGNDDIKKYNMSNLFLPSYVFTDYWENVYNTKKILNQQSPFAEYVDLYLKNNIINSNKNILNLGCGNNRDDWFFISKGYNVTAVDSAQKSFKKDNLDVIKSDIIYFVNHEIKKYDIIYSRFVLHSITEDDENILLSKIFKYMNKNCIVFLEFRTNIDELYGKGNKISSNEYIHNEHYRRFINPLFIRDRIKKLGFNIRYEETSDKFAIHNQFKPSVCRMILEKPSSVIDFEYTITDLESKNTEPIIKIYCEKRKYIWFKDINTCDKLFENSTSYIIYIKDGQQKILQGYDYIGPEFDIKYCSSIENSKLINYSHNETEFYFYIRGHIRNSFNTNKLKNFINLLKLRFPKIKFILQTWKNQECKKGDSWKKIKENNTIITKSTIENYFEDTNVTNNCLIIDENTIEYNGSTDGFVCSGPCPKKGWKNMWFGIFKGIDDNNMDDTKPLISFRFDYFDIMQTNHNEIQIFNFIENNLNTKNIKFIKPDNTDGVDNLYIGTTKNIKTLINEFHFNLDEIIKNHNKIFHQEHLVNIIASESDL